MRIVVALFAVAFVAADRPPNVVLIVADDLGYGDLGCYGQTKIRTPTLDRLAREGIRFTQAYAGSTVCAPSRCTLMTGLHAGHSRIRGNGSVAFPKSAVHLTPEDVAVPNVLKKAGYATALVGKWGLGEMDSPGVPAKCGFDLHYGYLNQVHAHNYYPDYLIRNATREPIPENVQLGKPRGVAAKPTTYAPDLLLKESLAFVTANKDRPFFLEFATIVPHANNEKTAHDKNGMEVPTDAPYTNEPWPQPEKNKAAMITRLDADVGVLLAKLAELGLAENTIVFFTSDNGPHKEGGNDPAFTRSSGPHRGIKRDLADGGIRVPLIAWGKPLAKPGRVSDHVCGFQDVLPTLAELAGAPVPPGLDGISFVPTLLGKGKQKSHEFLYWEFHEKGFKQAGRHANWKAIRLAPDAALALFDVVADPMEETDLAAKRPDVVAKMEAYFKAARTESKDYPIRK